MANKDEKKKDKGATTTLTRKTEEKPKETKAKDDGKYATERQPQWITNPPEESLVLPNGQTAHIYKKKEYLLLANKDWEKEGVGRLPGKTVRISFEAMDALATGYLRVAYNYKFKLGTK